MHSVKTILKFSTSILLFTLVLTACQGATPVPTQDPLEQAVSGTLTAMPAASATPSPTPTLEPTPTPTEEIIKIGPADFPDDVNPLTGLKVSDPAILDRRPVMVKVANYPRWGRPHAGLSKADIVFNYYTGQATNRFLALYYGQDSEKIGPVRSGRYIDRWLVTMYQGTLTMVGAWAPVLDSISGRLGNRLIQEGKDNCPAVCRLEQNEAGVFANSAEVSKYYGAKSSATNTRQDLAGMAFNTIPPSGGKSGTEFTMQYHVTNLGNWRYDAATHKYIAWIEDKNEKDEVILVPLVDRNTNEQLSFSNLVVVFAEIKVLNGDDTLHEYDILGSGKALYFRNGQVFEGTYKSDDQHPFKFLDAAGNPFEFQPGNTWINITGLNSEVTEETAGVWRVILKIP
jgi:hypothetical protein